MPKFRELGAESSPLSDSRLPPDPPGLIANRYVVQQSLGRGSFGTVFLINDTKAAPGEKLIWCVKIEINTYKINLSFIV
ncbi:serine/threonine-protein kinase Nek11 [Astyanax mexicanus]|uniref:NIMA related kinase 11 n=2 Tax=Astyanax mexicanus TaxID=7994 RepID=A0A3B1IXK2_ASTMX|nr:serine/threonine-protein kinase Nek11 [Astyanax mexicanus]